MEKNMELEEAIKIVKKDLESTKKANECGLSNNDFKKEIEATETVLTHLTKQEKMIELLIEDLQGEGCLNMTREEIDNYYERRIKLAEESE